MSMILFVTRTRIEMKIESEEVKTKDGKKTSFIYLNGALFFGTQELLTKEIEKLSKEGVQRFVISFRGVSSIDHSEVEEITELVETMKKEKKELLFCAISDDIKRMFDRLYISLDVPTYESSIDALEALR